MLTFEFRQFRVLLVQFCLRFGKLFTHEVGCARGLLFSLTGILRKKHGSNLGANLLCKLWSVKCRGDIESRQLMRAGTLHHFHGLDGNSPAQFFHQFVDVHSTPVLRVEV